MLTQLSYIEEYLKRKDLLDILKIQTTTIRTIEDFMVDRNFIQLMPVITSKVTDPLGPDPGSNVVTLPKIRYYDQELVLTQSMILHKQLALITGARKIFIFSPNIRLEHKARRTTGKHLFEFTQMDFEIAYAKMKDIMDLVEDLIIKVFETVVKEREEELKKLKREIKIPKKPFKVYTTHEMEEIYGKEWEIPASKSEKYPFWVICHKREFYDKEDPERPGHYLNYDLIYPEGYGEALSGGEREWEYKRIIDRIRRDGLNENMYRSYLEIAKQGLLIPSAGAGLGIERLIRFLTGKKHIGEIQVFRRIPGEEVIV